MKRFYELVSLLDQKTKKTVKERSRFKDGPANPAVVVMTLQHT